MRRSQRDTMRYHWRIWPQWRSDTGQGISLPRIRCRARGRSLKTSITTCMICAADERRDALDIEQLQQTLRITMGLRIGNEMAKYILAKLAAPSSSASFPILASDARTGQPVRPEINPGDVAVSP